MIDFHEPYESQYTVDLPLADVHLDGAAIGTVTTHMLFDPSPEGFIGQGEPDEEGDSMTLTLRLDDEGHLSGEWKEFNEEEGLVARGAVYFAVDLHDGELIGEWTNGQDRGSWSLVRMSKKGN